MDEELKERIQSLEKKIDDFQRSINAVKKIFLWTLVITLILFILPLVGLLFAIPQFLSNYSNLLQ